MLTKLKQWMRQKLQGARIRELEEESLAYMDAMTEACQDANNLQKDYDVLSAKYARTEEALQTSERDFATLQRQFAEYRIKTGNKLNAIRNLVN